VQYKTVVLGSLAPQLHSASVLMRKRDSAWLQVVLHNATPQQNSTPTPPSEFSNVILYPASFCPPDVVLLIMVLQLDHCTDADMARVFELVSISFGHEHPFIEAVYPGHETPSGRAHGTERMLAAKNGDPNTTFLKITDTSTGEIIGIAKWNVYDGVIPEEISKLGGDYWDTEDAKELAEWNYNEYVDLRRKAIRESKGNLVCTLKFCILPHIALIFVHSKLLMCMALRIKIAL
jgi:hypothetical protein